MTEVRILTSHLGWILEAFARESALAFGEQITINPIAVRKRDYLSSRYWRRPKLGRSSRDKVLFVHHETLIRSTDPSLIRDSRLLLTHFDGQGAINPKLLQKLFNISRIIVQNKRMFSHLTNNGLDSTKIRVGYGAVDRSKYFPLVDKTYQDFILIVGDCKPRKNPKLISEVVLANPDKNFVIHGFDWDKYLSKEILLSPNVKIIRFTKVQNPQLMRQARLLLSLSLNEGGPIPVLEALASGTPVLATETGFCKDVIPTEWGVVVPQNSNSAEISALIQELLPKKDECWSQDLLNGKFTWRDLGEVLYGN